MKDISSLKTSLHYPVMLEEVLKICEILSNISKTAINIGNTKYVKADSVGLTNKNFSKEGGGLSGSSLYENTLRIVKLIASNYNLPIIATGGVPNIDVLEEGSDLVVSTYENNFRGIASEKINNIDKVDFQIRDAYPDLSLIHI